MLKSFSIKTHNLGSVLLVALAIGATSCSIPQQTTTAPGNTTSAASPSSADSEKPNVVVTSSVLCGITEKIAQDTIDLTCLIPGGTDPHVDQPSPDDRKAIEQANLILYSGYGLELNLIKLIQATKNPAPKVAVSEIAVPRPIKGAEHEQNHDAQAKIEAEHEHGESDPHVWHNVQNGMRLVETIRDNLEKLSSSDVEKYSTNAAKITRELTQLDSWIKAQISTIPANQRQLVTTHDAMGYYSAAYGIPIEGALQGINTDERPTAGRMKELVQEIKQTSVPTIFAEATINPKLIEAVAREANVKVSNRVLFADGLGEKGSEGDTYEKMLIANTQAIVEGLGGKYTPFKLN